MKFRFQRGGLAESMETVVEIEPTIQALGCLIRKNIGFLRNVKNEDIRLEHAGFDERIGWDTYYVVIKNNGTCGMTNGPIA